MNWLPYNGEEYLDVDGVEAFCVQLAADHPRWARLEVVGQSRHGRPIQVLTIGDHTDPDGPGRRPAIWLDGGTHAVEWTGVMSCVFTVSRWVQSLLAGDEALTHWFSEHTAYILPCVSPDGVQAMYDGLPFLRSTLRPPVEGTVLTGLEPRDMDGDGAVRWMRWRHPAGPLVADEEVPIFMRPRRLDDDPADAFFMCDEGELVNWDGVRWTAAARRYGLDLNRNFPDAWRPFAMFGMDGGDYALSEPESRALVDAFRARRHIAAAVTNHTYTGCLLTAPSSADDPLDTGDIRLLELLAQQAVEGTDYRVIKKHPAFVYDPKNPIAGCWDDALTNTFGVAGYTLELWDPFRYAGVDNPDPAAFFKTPDATKIRRLLAKFSEDPGAVTPWKAFEHPQLGPVEIGGIDYLRTMRNPPVALLAQELGRGFAVADTIRQALPRVTVKATVTRHGSARRVQLVVENLGYLSTASLTRAETIGAAPPVSAGLVLANGQTLLDGAASQTLGHVDGWGVSQAGPASNAIYSALPGRGNRTSCQWLLEGEGPLTIEWQAGRAGCGRLSIEP